MPKKRGQTAKVGGGTILKGLIILMVGPFHEQNRSREDYKRWIEGQGGQCASKLTENVTHVVVTDAGFELRDKEGRQQEVILDALERERLPVLKSIWLDSALQAGKKPTKSRFNAEINWRQIAKDMIKKDKLAKAKEQAKAKVEDKTKDKAPKKRSQSKYVVAFEESAEIYANPKQKRAKRSHQSTSVADSSDTFNEAGRSAKSAILSNDYHYYIDETGFEYDVLLVKVLRMQNKNQLLHLRMYESHADPKMYAVVSLTTSLRTNHKEKKVAAGPGAPFATAFRGFKLEFEARTGVEWDKRFEVFKRAVILPDTPKSSLITPAEILAAGGARHGPSGKAMTDKEWSAFEEQPWIWRGPPIGKPEGVIGPIAAPKMAGTQAFDSREDSVADTDESGDSDMVDVLPAPSYVPEEAVFGAGRGRPSAPAPSFGSSILKSKARGSAENPWIRQKPSWQTTQTSQEGFDQPYRQDSFDYAPTTLHRQGVATSFRNPTPSVAAVGKKGLRTTESGQITLEDLSGKDLNIMQEMAGDWLQAAEGSTEMMPVVSETTENEGPTEGSIEHEGQGMTQIWDTL